MARRIETTTSRTAEMTCLARAFSALETNPYLRSDDTLAPLLLPNIFRLIARVPLLSRLFMHMVAPKGINEYVIARTKYIDAAFQQSLADSVEQVLIFGAGFDTRALRFQNELQNAKVFELDAPITQQAKLGQYHRRGLVVPANLNFISIDFDRESLPEKLAEAGFDKRKKSLFLLEGVLMYLQPVSVDATFRTIQEQAARGSRIVFDFVNASVFKNEGLAYGENGIVKTVSSSGEEWHFGLEANQVAPFLGKYSMRLLDLKDPAALERTYFTRTDGKLLARVNGTHNLAVAEKV
jgi:methyltransferase (TIGR00027 family)